MRHFDGFLNTVIHFLFSRALLDLQFVHQVRRIFRPPKLMEKLVSLSSNKNNKFTMVCKDGADGFGDIKQFRGLQIKQSNVFASVIVPVSVHAEDVVTKESEVVWINPRVNSCTAVIPLRYSFEKETDENSLAECKRLEAEVEALKPFKFDGFGGIEVDFDVFSTELDGKGKGVWAETRGKSTSCTVCDATPEEMSKRFLKKFKKFPKKRLRFGFSNCHLKQRSLHWLVKGTEYRDFKRWSKSKKDGTAALAKMRKDEYQVSFLLLAISSFLSFFSLTFSLMQCCPPCK